MQISPLVTINSLSAPSQIIEQMLRLRGHTDVQAFLNPPTPMRLSSDTIPSLGSRALAKAARIITDAHAHKKTILIYGDYDVDGITATYILWYTLHRLGIPAHTFIPSRHSLGYGLSIKGIDHVISTYSPSLIITVDNGINAGQATEYAHQKGIDVIITDHHQPGSDHPTHARAIIHSTDLSGAGVSYYLARELADHFNKYTTGFDRSILPYVALGTIADLVPLTHVSRSLTLHGLRYLKTTQHIGLRRLLNRLSLDEKDLTSFDIGYVLAPKLNAFGRVGEAIDALHLLSSADFQIADTFIDKALHLNVHRQYLVERSVKEAMEQLTHSASPFRTSDIQVVYLPSWNEGIIGLIAAKILELTGKATLALTNQPGSSIWKGSGRSPQQVHMMDVLHTIGTQVPLLSRGGHAQAAGFSLEESNLASFLKAASSIVINTAEYLDKGMYVDVATPLANITPELAHITGNLQPFGPGNPDPLFYTQIQVNRVVPLGKKGSHFRLYVQDERGTPCSLPFLLFNTSLSARALSQLGSIVFTLSINEWHGSKTPQAIIKHHS